MRLFGRNDLVLLGGFTVALFVVFARPVAQLLEFAREIDQTRGVQLLPALVILATVFIFQQAWKRHEMKTAALVASTKAREATQRANEMERLVMFGQALARSLEHESIRSAAMAHLPLIAPGHGVWAMTRSAAHWESVVAVGDTSLAERELAACKALGDVDAANTRVISDVCFPMIVAGEPVGVLGVSAEPPLSDQERSMLAATAALLGVSLKNAELFREIKDNSVRDSLTGCFNRRHALDVMDGELRRARRSSLPLSLVMFDLDHFKAINDTHGHLCGDAVLASVGARMKAILRGSDVKCRYGGEEFMIVLPDTPIAGACRVADMLRQDIADHPVQWNNLAVNVTASFGVTAITPGEIDPLVLMARADGALYRAKQDGRNCVRVAEETAALA